MLMTGVNLDMGMVNFAGMYKRERKIEVAMKRMAKILIPISLVSKKKLKREVLGEERK